MTCAPISGPATARLAVLGEAPYPGEHEPFTSEHGLWFREQLAEAGISPLKLTFLYCVSSTPASPGLEYRAPTTSELRSEHHEREARIAAIDPQFILLVGNVALQVYRPDLTIGLAHGHPFCRSPYVFDSVLFFPTFHPAGVMRDQRWMPQLRDDLARLLAVGKDPENWDLYIPDTCVMCGATGQMFCDPYLATYCDAHDHERRHHG